MARLEVVQGFGEADGHMAVVQNGLADVLRRQGGSKFAQAEVLYNSSLRTTERVYGRDDVRYAQALQNLGLYCSDAGRHREGLQRLSQALAVKEAIFGKLHIECARVRATHPCDRCTASRSWSSCSDRPYLQHSVSQARRHVISAAAVTWSATSTGVPCFQTARL